MQDCFEIAKPLNMKSQRIKIQWELVIFLGLALFLSFFIFWGPIAFFQIPTVNLVDGPIGSVGAILLFVLGGFVPSLVGIVLTGWFEGRKGLKEIFKSSVQFRFPVKRYFQMFASATFLALGSILLVNIVGENIDLSQFYRQLPALLPLIILGPLSEEYGWRGFALKRLLFLFNPAKSSLILGVVWSVWHLPLFYLPGTSQFEFGLPFWVFLISVTSTSFVYTWFYLKTGGSLFSAIFLHWIFTYVMQVLASSTERTDLFNQTEFLPALILGIIFYILLKRSKRSSFYRNKSTFLADSSASSLGISSFSYFPPRNCFIPETKNGKMDTTFRILNSFQKVLSLAKKASMLSGFTFLKRPEKIYSPVRLTIISIAIKEKLHQRNL